MTVCDADKCAGCMLCLEVCKKGAIRVEDGLKAYNAVIDEGKCISCGACHSLCPQNSEPDKILPIAWYQGWSRDEEIRNESPSGGLGMALSKQFIFEGGYVCSCSFRDGKFDFDITNNPEDIKNFSGSKYVKSNPHGIYKEILQLIKSGEKVLFIGLPCQAAAVKKYVGKAYAEKLYLVDLICHGTPSPTLLEVFLNQYSKSLNGLQSILFRIKSKMQIVTDGLGIVRKGVSDKYTIAFLNGLTYTDNCYSCKYASEDRVSDITIGDSWGSTLDSEQIKKGVSLVLAQTEKGQALLHRADIELLEVDIENAKNNNGQLRHPMREPESRKAFLDGLTSKNFNRRVFSRYPKQCLKQDIKYILLKSKLIK